MDGKLAAGLDRHRGDVDDHPLPPLDHGGDGRFQAVECPLQVDVQHAVEFFLCQIQERNDAVYTGVVDQDIYPPVGSENLLEQAGDLLAIR